MHAVNRNGRPYTSRQIPWIANSPFPVDLSFLDTALEDFHSPVVDHLKLEFTGSITTVGVSFLSEDQARVYQQIFLKDGMGERIDLRGTELRAVNFMLFGSGYEDPAAIGVGVTANTTVWLTIPGEHPYKMRRRTDGAISVRELIEKGELRLRSAAAVVVTGCTINSGNYRMHAYIRERIGPQAQSRMRWKSDALTLLEDTYAIGGQLFAAWPLAQVDPGPGYTSWLGMTEVDSMDLGYSDTLNTYLQEVYRAESRGIFATDQLESGVSFPTYFPRYGQSLADLPNLRTLKLRYSGIAVPANSRLITGVLTDRDAEIAAKDLGFESPGAAAVALARGGHIAGTAAPWKDADAILRGRLPVALNGK